VPFHRRRLLDAGWNDGEAPQSDSDWQRVPHMTRDDQVAAVADRALDGPLWHEETALITHTPAPGFGLLPEFHTEDDLVFTGRVFGEYLRRAGVEAADIAVLTQTYHVVLAGHYMHRAFAAAGARVVPMGPGETERLVETVNRLGAQVLAAFPSFALKLAESGAKGRLRLLVAGGEPFSSIDGYRERIQDAFATPLKAIDLYGLSGCPLIAAECKHQAGMHLVDELVYAEVIDPETHELLPYGERGELVVTHVHRNAMPFLRFRTGDLTVLENRPCICGKRLTLTHGVFGRTNEMYRVKGVKLYPSSLGFCLAGIEGVNARNFRVILTRPKGQTDHLRLEVHGDPAVVDVDAIKQVVKARLVIAPNQVVARAEWEDGPVVVDQRGGVDR